jgi:hypothetical protein
MAKVAIAHNSGSHLPYAKRISGHIAYALVVYTLMLIFLVAPLLKGNGMAIWPYFALVALVAAVILPCRNMEKLWQKLDEKGVDMERHFFWARVRVWVGAIGIPLLLMAGLRGISA